MTTLTITSSTSQSGTRLPNSYAVAKRLGVGSTYVDTSSMTLYMNVTGSLWVVVTRHFSIDDVLGTIKEYTVCAPHREIVYHPHPDAPADNTGND